MAFSAYSVAVRLNLVQNVTSGLAAMSTALARTGRQVDDINAKLRTMRALALGGVALGGVGVLGMGMIKGMLPEGKEYIHQLQQMRQAGMSVLEIEQARAAAIKNLRVAPTSSTMNNLATISELRTVFGADKDTGSTVSEAINALPTLTKMQAILSTVSGVKDAKGVAYEVAKLLDIRGKTENAAAFEREANMATKLIVASRGTVTPRDLFGTGKYGRAATAGWSEEFMYEILPTLIQEMKAAGGAGGAGGPGNALMTAYATVIQGKIAKKNLKNWTAVNLLDESKIVKSAAGIGQGVEMGAVKGWREFQANPFAWVQKYLVPELNRLYGNDEAAKKAHVERMFGTRTEAFVMAQMALQPWKFTRDQDIIRKANGLEGYAKMVRENPYAAEQAFSMQWKSLQGELAIHILPVLIAGLTKFTNGLITVTEFFNRNPAMAKAVVWTLAFGSALALLGGWFLLARAAIIGLGMVFQATGLTRTLGLAGRGIAMFGGFLARAIPWIGRAAPLIGRLGLTFLRFIGPVGWAITAVVLLVKFWPQISSFLGKVKDGFVGLIDRVLGWVGKLFKAKPPKTDASGNPTGPTPGVANTDGQGNVVRGPLRFHGAAFTPMTGAQLAKLGPETRRRYVRADGSVSNVEIRERSPYVRGRAYQGEGQGVGGNVYMDGRKVGDIVSGHQARAAGQTRVGVARHDPRATPAAPGGGYNR